MQKNIDQLRTLKPHILCINKSIPEKQKIFFIDRDGVINDNSKYYVTSISDIVILPRVKEALNVLSEHGYSVIIITNQACIGKGLITLEEETQINKSIVSTIDSNKIIKGVICCPHLEEWRCSCRKPRVGMIYAAIEYFKLDIDHITSFWLIGDSKTDIECGRSVGIRCIQAYSEKHQDMDLYASILKALEVRL